MSRQTYLERGQSPLHSSNYTTPAPGHRPELDSRYGGGINTRRLCDESSNNTRLSDMPLVTFQNTMVTPQLMAPNYPALQVNQFGVGAPINLPNGVPTPVVNVICSDIHVRQAGGGWLGPYNAAADFNAGAAGTFLGPRQNAPGGPVYYTYVRADGATVDFR
ncbi:hypothetical protein E1B28_006413 [Marasmius oreades]|uniref:Uncharacterized protein n=1 Tax=Marasmius oreades TaxID=181124 RepID=A0A9P7S5C3_9AGAR|nr:uncharacterized protein E1B28_006413 [Marasmius oreades]KAG7095699.1 hypothetical protein E1B28_006413 [Marasmius oreades]